MHILDIEYEIDTVIKKDNRSIDNYVMIPFSFACVHAYYVNRFYANLINI